MSNALSAEQILAALKDLPGWSYHANALHKDFDFQNFREAISFIVRLSFEAESLNHHPELHNVYSRVKISLNTHDAGNQVTDKDLELARAIEGFSWVR